MRKLKMRQIIDKKNWFEKPITFLHKSTTEKQGNKASIRALNKNTEKNDETENEREWGWVENEIQTIAVETNDTKVFETTRHFGKRMEQVLQMLQSSHKKSFKKRIIERRHGRTPTKTTTHVSDCTRMTCVTYDNGVPQSIPVSKISVDRGKEQNANRHAAPYSAASGTVKSFKKINNDTNGCNNDGIGKTPAMWKKKAEQDVPVDATLNAIKDKIWTLKMVLLELRLNLRAKEFETVEIEDDNQINKPKYHTTGSETNSQTSVPPAEDEVFAEAGNGRKLVLPVQEEVCTEEANRRKEVLLVEEGMFTDGTNERKQVLPVRIESHKESPDKEIIALQREGKSITLLLTDCQPNVQVLQRMSKTMLTQTISLAACTKDLDLFQQDLKKKKMDNFSLADAVKNFKNDFSSYPSFSFSSADLKEGGTHLFLLSFFYSFETPRKENFNLRELWKTINLGDVWKALQNPVLKNLSIWPHGRMVRTYDSTRTDWLTELYGESRSFVYNYKFSFLFFVQFRLTLSHWQGVVKINVLFVNPLIMTEEILSPKKNGNSNIHPKISTMSLTFHDNDDPGPRQRIAFQSRPQTGIVKTSLQFDANKKSEGNVMEKPPVLKAMRKKVDNDVVMKYTHTNYGRKNGIEPNCRTFEILFFKENALKKTLNRIFKTLLDFDVNKKNEENALSKAPVLQVMEKELEASHTESILLEYRADTELNKYDRQNGTQPDRKTFDARPLNKNTPRKTPLREKLCTVSETNDETRCMSQPMEHKGIYSIYLNSIAINKQVKASKPTELYPAPNIYQKDGKLCTVSETNDETRCMMRPMENEGSYFIYLNSIAINKQVPASKTTCAKLDSAPNIHQRETDVGVDVITGIETGGPFLKNMAVPFKDREEVRERREVRLDPHQGVIREPNIGGRAFNDNPPMNT